MEQPPDLDQRISGIASLDQPLRRDLYRLVAEADGWVTRDAAAEALGVARTVAAFHLDKLVDAGVLEVSQQRTSGRSGPGAGRPAKVYRRAVEEVSASVPERRYDLAGSLLAAAVVEAESSGAPVGKALAATARKAGRELGEEAASTRTGASRSARFEAVVEVLERHGYEPRLERRREVVLLNCPFHRLAEEHRSLVCGMNQEFLAGILEGLGPAPLEARLQPEPGYCCVRITSA